ncbi:hypothetical protein AALF85_05320 [Jeotgalicoccus halotolerans]|uniref:hypothetical protein n=1 Tax=Jeotgalicoccus halotolerans TaxID=157227 RepID=UPI003516CB06
MNSFEELIEQLERVSEYHIIIIEYINDVHNIDDFEYIEEFNDRYLEIEQMIIDGELM